jgi:hypothetical protein
MAEPADVTEREVRDLPWSGFRTTVVIEFYRVRCPDCGLKIEKVEQLPSKAPHRARIAGGRDGPGITQKVLSKNNPRAPQTLGPSLNPILGWVSPLRACHKMSQKIGTSKMWCLSKCHKMGSPKVRARTSATRRSSGLSGLPVLNFDETTLVRKKR